MKAIPRNKYDDSYETPRERLVKFGPEVLANQLYLKKTPIKRVYFN